MVDKILTGAGLPVSESTKRRSSEVKKKKLTRTGIGGKRRRRTPEEPGGEVTAPWAAEAGAEAGNAGADAADVGAGAGAGVGVGVGGAGGAGAQHRQFWASGEERRACPWGLRGQEDEPAYVGGPEDVPTARARKRAPVASRQHAGVAVAVAVAAALGRAFAFVGRRSGVAGDAGLRRRRGRRHVEMVGKGEPNAWSVPRR
jgi:hypothetical protein